MDKKRKLCWLCFLFGRAGFVKLDSSPVPQRSAPLRWFPVGQWRKFACQCSPKLNSMWKQLCFLKSANCSHFMNWFWYKIWLLLLLVWPDTPRLTSHAELDLLFWWTGFVDTNPQRSSVFDGIVLSHQYNMEEILVFAGLCCMYPCL